MRSQVGTNLPKVGNYNQNVVLDTIRSLGSTSRVELADRTGLTAQTISVIVRRLLVDGLIREDGAQSSGAGGKPRTTLRVEPAAGYAVGIHFDPGQISGVLMDLSGDVITTAQHEIRSSVHPEEAAALMGRAVRKVIRDGGVQPKRVLGVGVACPGPIDQELGMVLFPPRLAGWERVPLETLLHDSTGYPVVIDNDATAAAIGERWSGLAKDTANFVYIYLGTGIGGGLFLANQVYRGAFRNAAEIGHITAVPDGSPCYCGNRGCLEAVACPAAMVAETHELLAKGRDSALGPAFKRRPAAVDHPAICAAAAEGDPLARGVVDRAAARVADVAVSVVNMLDIELIVLGGPALGPVGDVYRDAIAAALADRPIARRIHQTPVSLSPSAQDAGAIGAASLVFHQAFAPELAVLLSR